MIGLLGISYKTAPLEVREKFAFPDEEIVPFSEFLQQETEISDIVLLSTCNRTELYFSQDKYDRQSAFELVFNAMLRFKNIDLNCWHQFYHLWGCDAVRHLYKVASGLDSMILGEDQIIGQVKESYLFCTKAALTDAVLMRLFQKSFEAGKRVRTETGIKLGTTSVSSAAVELCAQLFGDLTDKSVLLIGAGETGSLALQNIVQKGVTQITVANRTLERAQALADEHNGNVLHFDEFNQHLHKYDIVVVATGAQSLLITSEMVEQAQQCEECGTQVFIDLSVPRNIDENIGDLAGVQLFGVDDLEEVVRESAEKKLECVDSALEIIEEVVADFNEWMASRSLRPVIKTISSKFQKFSQLELAEAKKKHSNEVYDAIVEYDQQLTQRYMNLLVKNLKDMTDNGKTLDSLQFVTELFKKE